MTHREGEREVTELLNKKTELIPCVLIPTMILLHPTLSAEAKVLYGILQTWDLPDKDGHRKGFIYPSVKNIVERSGMARASVGRGLALLEKVGAIRTQLGLRKTATRELKGMGLS